MKAMKGIPWWAWLIGGAALVAILTHPTGTQTALGTGGKIGVATLYTLTGNNPTAILGTV